MYLTFLVYLKFLSANNDISETVLSPCGTYLGSYSTDILKNVQAIAARFGGHPSINYFFEEKLIARLRGESAFPRSNEPVSTAELHRESRIFSRSEKRLYRIGTFFWCIRDFISNVASIFTSQQLIRKGPFNVDSERTRLHYLPETVLENEQQINYNRSNNRLECRGSWDICLFSSIVNIKTGAE